MTRYRVMAIRILAVLLLAVAATQPLSVCNGQRKSRRGDGSLTFREVQQDRHLWQEINPRHRLLDTSMVILCFAWPLPFLLFRGLRRTSRTRWPLGVIECAVGGLFLVSVWAVATSPCWSLGGMDDPGLKFGFYGMMAGGMLYLAAWPIELALRRRSGAIV